MRHSTYLAVDKESGDVIAYNNVKDVTEQNLKENQMHQYEQMLVMTASGMYQGVWQIADYGRLCRNTDNSLF